MCGRDLQLQARTLGCFPPKALSERWPLHWGGCNFIPEDLHPKSFRGYFGHNTNVWAAASRKGLNVGYPWSPSDRLRARASTTHTV